jgi:hypothetical protein
MKHHPSHPRANPSTNRRFPASVAPVSSAPPTEINHAYNHVSYSIHILSSSPLLATQTNLANMSDINAIAKQFTGASGAMAQLSTVDLAPCSSRGVGGWRVESYWSNSGAAARGRGRRAREPVVQHLERRV